MAKLMLIGDVTYVEILTDPDDEETVLARCVPGRLHGETCVWEMRFSSFEAAISTPFAERHADTGRG